MRRVLARHTLALLAGAALLVALLVAPLAITQASPSFFGRYVDLAHNYEELQTSAHAGIACQACHTDPRGGLAAGLALVGDFYTGLVTERYAPVFLEFDPPRREACLACHETVWIHQAERVAQVPHPVHPRLASETRECVECHKWTAHMEPQAQAHKEMPFSGLCVAYGCHVGFRPADQCTSCHHTLRDAAGGTAWLDEHPTVARELGTSACLEVCHDADQCRLCHTTGERPVFEGLRAETGLEEIEWLHTEPDWTESHGPVAFDDEVACMRCHITDSECRACHATRPSSHDPVETWISRHKDIVVDERRCHTCHQPSWCQECHDQFKEMG